MQTVSKVSAVTPECLFLILFSNKAAAFSSLKKVIFIYSAVLLLLILYRASEIFSVLQLETYAYLKEFGYRRQIIYC